MKFEKPIILVHGGAGSFKRLSRRDLGRYRKCLRDATINGYEVLANGSALDAVTEAVKTMEDCEVMNAGVGSVLNLLGEIEMDAGIMDGSSLRAAGVALIKRVRNPILLAKIVLEKTDHVLLAGEFAEELGFKHGLKPLDRIYVERKKEKHKRLFKEFLNGKGFKHLSKIRNLVKELNITFHDTVGAVALDINGNLASATSTGGYWLKLPGRIGDSPVVGAGFYANKYAAASATGIGEYILMTMLCLKAVEYVEKGLHANEASRKAIDYITGIYGKDTAGIIVIDNSGYVGASFNTEGMGRGIMAKNMSAVKVAVYKNEEFI